MNYSILLFVVVSLQILNAQTLTSFSPTSDISGSNFGTSVDIDNHEILVSSISNSESPGKVYLFNTENGIVQTNVFYPDESLPSDNFGQSFSIAGNFIAIGSPLHDTEFANQGAVYVYKKNGSNYDFLQKITAADAMPEDHFGSKVKIKDNFLYISANGDEQDSETDTNRGSISVYIFNGTQWIFSQKLQTIETSDSVPIPKLGENFAINNNYMSVQSDTWQTNYTLINGFWIFQDSHQIAGFSGLEDFVHGDFTFSENQSFYLDTPFSSQYLIIGDINGNGSGSQTFELPHEFPDGYVGYGSLAVSDGDLFVGNAYTGLPAKHPILYYRKNGSQWQFRNIFYGNAPEGIDDYFGASMATSGGLAVFGAPKEGNGKAYFANEAALPSQSFVKSGLDVYPNPVQNILFVKSDFTSVDHLEIYSINGKLLISAIDNPKQIDLGNLESGFYFADITAADGTKQSFKIVKN